MNEVVEPTVWPKNSKWNIKKAKDDKLSREVWELTKPHIFSKRNAIDVGTRFGGVAHYMCQEFNMTYCFDIKKKLAFTESVIKEKVTHYNCPLGYKFKIFKLDEWRANPDKGAKWHHNFKQEWLENAYNIDDFNFENIDYYKIDTDGSEDTIIAGSEQTIKTHTPLVVIEAFKESQIKAVEMLIDWGYKVMKTKEDDKRQDKVLLHESRL